MEDDNVSRTDGSGQRPANQRGDPNIDPATGQPRQAYYTDQQQSRNPRYRMYDHMQSYGAPMDADQHRHRMQMMEFDERLHRLEDCIYEIKDMVQGGSRSQQRGRSSSGRFTSGPGSAGSRGYDEGSRSEMRGYQDGYEYGYADAHRDHVHRMNGYTGPSIPYDPESQQSAANMQHWGRGRGGWGGYGYAPYYVDPLMFYAMASMQSGDAAIN